MQFCSYCVHVCSTDVFLLTVDGCNNYTVLSEADRAQGHIVINASNYGCDRNNLVPGWYRFQGAAGNQMADKCIPMDHCGTLYSGWLSGTHPTVAEGVVTHTVCFPESYTCCRWHQIIRIKNCGAYFVYELPWTYRCPARYCGNRIAGKLLRMYLIISGSSQNTKLQ